MNSPRTIEGERVWLLAERLDGQLRAVSGAVLGWDMAAALAMARALGVEPAAVAEFLPEIEAAMVRKRNEAIRRDG